jgi:hypothetical protein
VKAVSEGFTTPPAAKPVRRRSKKP